MAWGKSNAGIDDLLQRVRSNDEKLQSLTILRMRQLNEQAVASLAAALRANTVLRELTCSSHAISTEGCAALADMLEVNNTLERISIGDSSLGDAALAALAQGVARNTTLRDWDLEHKGLTAASAAAVLAALQQHPALRRMTLSRNAGLRDAGVARLCGGPWAALQQLQLADCGLTAEGAASLADAASLAQLRELDLSHNPLGPSAGEALARLLQRAPQLQGLRLRGTGLGGAGVSALARALPAAAALRRLDLSDTQLEADGVRALAAALGSGGFGAAPSLSPPAAAAPAAAPAAAAAAAAAPAAAAAAAAGAQRALLRELLLAGNPGITDEAVAALAQALAAGRINTLQQQQEQQQQEQQEQQQQLSLDLSGSSVAAGGIQALSAVPGLAQLSLFDCRLGAGDGAPMRALCACAAAGGFASLRGLNLSGCQLGMGPLAALAAALAPPPSGAHTQPQPQQQLADAPQQQQEDAPSGTPSGALPQAGAATSSGSGSGSSPARCLLPLPALDTLELGGNPATQEGGCEALVAVLREARPGLDVHWRVMDQGDQQGPAPAPR